MKTFLTFTLICIISASIFSQEIPKLNFGVGYPLLIPNSDYSFSDGSLYFDTNQNFFAEIPFFIHLKTKPVITFSPGISYVSFDYSRDHGGNGGGSFGNFTRSAVSFYLKSQLIPNFSFTGNHNWNFGFIAGYYLHTHVDSKVVRWAVQAGPDYYKSFEFSGNSKDFFNSFYFGFVTGFQFNFKKVRFLKPAVELSFFPGYVNNAADFSSKDVVENRSMIMSSIILGIGSKKLSNESKKVGPPLN